MTKTVSPEAHEWAARIRAAWSNVAAARQEARVLNKLRGPGRETKNVEGPLALTLIERGHTIRRQVRCPAGRVDIFDDTTNEIIECKAQGSLVLIVEAAKQLQRYECHFPGAAMVICVPSIHAEAQWMAAAVRAIGIRIIEVEGGIG